MTSKNRSGLIKRAATEHGFDRCGITTAGPVARGDFYAAWLARGHAGSMAYLYRHQNSRRDLRSWLPWAKSVIVLAASYYQGSVGPPWPTQNTSESSRLVNDLTDRTAAVPHRRDAGATRGRVAMYAWGEDYHKVLREKLDRLAARMRSLLDTPFQARVCVDTSAIIERELAAMAGVGWIGKNTMVLHQSLGSFFFLGEIVTDLELDPDAPAADRCGTCTRCLQACPTAAFPQAYSMDASRCTSYLTIEHRGEIPGELASRMGDWVFGCDVCQTVCPYNRHAAQTSEARFRGGPDDAWPAIDDILSWDEAAYRTRVNAKAWKRAELAMWRRNARIARENSRSC